MNSEPTTRRRAQVRRLAELLAALLVTGAVPASGQSPPAAAPAATGRALAATCSACHGTDGKAVAGSGMVALAGLPREHVAGQMRAFRDGSRASTVMQQIAKGYTDAQIDAMAAYFATVR